MRAAADGPRSDVISASSTISSVSSSSLARLTACVRFSLSRSDVLRKPPNSRSLHDGLGLSASLTPAVLHRYVWDAARASRPEWRQMAGAPARIFPRGRRQNGSASGGGRGLPYVYIS